MTKKKILDEKTFFKEKRKKELIYIAVLIIPFLVFYLNFISGFNQLPSPLYGGDYYFHYGVVQHIYNGNAPWTNPQILGEYNHYGWLYHSLVAYTARIFGFDVMKTFLFFPLVVLILSGITSFYIGKKLFKKDYWAFLFSFIWLGIITAYSQMHARPFAQRLLIPLFFLMFLNFNENKSLKNRIFLGLIFGALGLTHIMAFASAGLFLIVYFVYELIVSYKHKITNVLNRAKEFFRDYWLPVLIGIVVSMPYLGPLLFVYKLNTLNNQPAYSSRIPGISNLFVFLKEMFFDYSSFFVFILSLFALIGFCYIVKNREEFSNKIIFMLFITIIAGGFYYFITMPLGIDIMVYWQFLIYLPGLLKAVLLTIGIIAVINTMKKVDIKYSYIAIGLIGILLIAAAVQQKHNEYSDRWADTGRQEQNIMFSMAQWVKQNTDKNDVFLSTNENSFALFSLTGRKIVVNRGTHTSQFVDLDERMTDASIMLYGNDSEKTKELIKKYNISYVYYDQNWISNLQWDPFLVFPKNSGIFDKYNVSYNRVNKKLDPGKEGVPLYDLLEPVNDNLWSEKFEEFIYPVMFWGESEQPYIVIFRVNNTLIEK
ncbi:hypothetical protein JW949_01385 [Candidatus Woesearchaeota archaeon]|nr:hypothetical protein [Candidatus Woesearchaeota archaeon]